MDTLREAGVLLPIRILKSKHKHGSFKDAMKAVDFLHKSKQKIWHIEPIMYMDEDFNPYKVLSHFALDPIYADLDEFINMGLLSTAEIFKLDEEAEKKFEMHDKELIKSEKLKALRLVYKRAYQDFTKETIYQDFIKDNAYWLKDFALFMSLAKDKKAFEDFDANEININIYKESITEEVEDEVKFQEFVQFLLYRQYLNLKNYANGLGVKVLCDVPLYASEFSSDVWAKKDYFEVDNKLRPLNYAINAKDQDGDLSKIDKRLVYSFDFIAFDNYEYVKEKYLYYARLFDYIRLVDIEDYETTIKVDAKTLDQDTISAQKNPIEEIFAVLKENSVVDKVFTDYITCNSKVIRKIVKDNKIMEARTIQDAFDINPNNKSLPLNLDKMTIYYSSDFDMKELDKYLNSSSDMKLRVQDYTNKKDFTTLDIVERMYSSNASKVVVAIWDLVNDITKKTDEVDIEELGENLETILKQYMVQFSR
ncbi:4-alpha-glucanotransferase [Fenollaria sporofastidiosus]|uniref:4-alpha-glucanotransferase n=1 Tax=Fenollaria sporofastidiosus TaxID=2811778 RepID=UPI001C0044AD|nr:4-alpha-glucanotransferase [Fenollaria sporofastidiosus]